MRGKRGEVRLKRWLMCPSLSEPWRLVPFCGGVLCDRPPAGLSEWLACGRQFLALSRRNVGVGAASWRTGVAARCVTMTMHGRASATKQLNARCWQTGWYSGTNNADRCYNYINRLYSSSP